MTVHELKQKSRQGDTEATDAEGDQTDKKWQITNQKNEIHVEYTDCRFNETTKISHLIFISTYF